MIYSKLPIVFLSTIASEKSGSTNFIIATYILNHLDQLQHTGIKDLAAHCHVAVSSISRFCKEIGLNDFMELRELLLSPSLYFENQSDSLSFDKRTSEYSQNIQKSIELVEKTINANKLSSLCKDIHQYSKVGAFGLLKAASATLCLQADLLMLGKQINTHIAYHEQMTYILEAGPDDLMIIFSYTGTYFDYQELRSLKKRLNQPKIWLITGEIKEYPEFIDDIITFSSPQNQGGHPYQLLFIANLIAQEYAKLYGK